MPTRVLVPICGVTCVSFLSCILQLARLFHGSGYTSVVSCMVNTVGPHPVSWRYSYHASGSCDTTWYNQDRQPDPAMALKAKIIKLRPGIGLMELELVMSILRPGDSRIY